MDIVSVINNRGYVHENPEYNPKTKKGKLQPQYIVNADPNGAINQGSALARVMSQPGRQGMNLDYLGKPEKYAEYDVTVSPIDSSLERELANEQGIINKAANSLVQMASEVTLGTVKGFSDLFDMLIYNRLRDDIDYQNPVSATLEDWQKAIREDIAPIYADPDKNIFNGGLTDSGFIFQGLPSIMSSLTLMIPSRALTLGGAKLIRFLGNKGVAWMRRAEQANRAIVDGKKLSKAAKLDMLLNDANAYRRTKEFAEFGVGGFTSRLLENYQEARQTYRDSKDVYTEIWNRMDSNQRAETIQRLKNENGENAIDWNNEDEVIDLVSRNAADKTFISDLWNTGFDIYQMYSLAKPLRAINGPSRAALRRYQRTQLKNLGKSEKEINDIIANRTRWQKTKDAVSDFAFGAKHTMLAELSEGVEEAVNYIAQEEGMTYGKMLLGAYDGGDFGQRMKNYLVAPKLWDSAFWGFMGGIAFAAGGAQINRLTDARRIQQQAEDVNKVHPELQVKVPTFWEAYRQTENDNRLRNLKSRADMYKKTIGDLTKIKNGEDINGITQNGKLESEGEIEAARNYRFFSFVDDVLLDAMDSGNYDMAREFLESDELANAFVESGHMSKEDMDKLRTNIRVRGEELIKKYNKHLRIARNAAESLGKENHADLWKIPAEFFNLVARQNIKHELTAEYFQSQIDAINDSDLVLEDDVRKKLDEAGVDFKGMMDTIMTAHQIGMINAQIADIENSSRKSTLTGQNDLRLLKLQKKVLEEGLSNQRIINKMPESSVDRLSRILLGLQNAASVEVVPGSGTTEGNPTAYQANTANSNYITFKNTVESKDKELIKKLHPAIAELLNSTPVEEQDDLIARALRQSNVANQQVETIYKDNKTGEVTGEAKLLKSISEQLATNYANLSTYQHLKNFELAQIAVSKDEVLQQVHMISNFFNEDKQVAIEQGNALFHHLAKKYGKDNILNELTQYLETGTHSKQFDSFDKDEKDAFEYYVKLMNLNQPQNDLLLGDIRRSLSVNEIHDFTIDKPIVERILAERRRAAEKSTTSEKADTAASSSSVNDSSSDTVETADGAENREIEEKGTANEGEPNPSEDTEGEVTLGDAGTDDTSTDDTSTDDTTGKDEAIYSTGEGTQPFDEDSAMIEIADGIKELSAAENLSSNDETVISRIRDAFKQGNPDLTDEAIDVLFSRAKALNAAESGEEYRALESELADGVIRLSAIGTSDPTSLAAQRAKQILNSSFEELLKTYNTYLGRGTVNGKQVIYLESLLRYAKAITNNKYSAEQVFSAINKIIVDNPDKYIVASENKDTQNIIQEVAKPITVRRANLDDRIGGKNFNFKAVLDSVDKDTRKKVEAALDNCKVGDKVICRLNTDPKKKDSNGNPYENGIDFYLVTEEGEILVAQAPTPAVPKGTSYYKGTGHWVESENKWWYQFSYDANNPVEYDIEKFFKDLLTSNDTDAVEFRRLLHEYEALKFDEYEALESQYVAQAYPHLEAFAKKKGYNIDDPSHKINKRDYLYQKNKLSFEDKCERFRHISALDVFVLDEQALVLESLGFVKRTAQEEADAKRESIHQWFLKMIESSNARQQIKDDIKASDDSSTIVTIATKNEPTLIITDEAHAAPVSVAIADKHKDSIKIATGTIGDSSTVTASGQVQPFSMVGVNTKSRTVVLIDKPQGGQAYINAYPINMKAPAITTNNRMKAFKLALETRLKELLDEWKDTKDSTALQAFIYELVGVDSKASSLFRGFRPQAIPNTPNGFRIPFRVKNGEIVPITDTEGTIHYLNFFDSVPSRNGRVARAAVQEFDTTPGVNNSKATVWNRTPKDTSNLTAQARLEKRIIDVVINSLIFKVDPLYILADNSPSVTHTGIASRDADGNFILKVSGIKNVPKALEDYKDEDGNIVIDGFGSFGDFILKNDLVNLSTTHYGDSNFKFLDNNDGQLGITYTLDNNPVSSPVEGINVTPPAKPAPVEETLRTKVESIFDKASKAKRKQNVSRQLLISIIDKIGPTHSLYTLIYGENKSNKKAKIPEILDKLLHNNVRYVPNINGASIQYDENNVQIIPDTVSAMYVPSDCTLITSDGKIELNAGEIIVGDIFMNWLDGNNTELYDAVRAIIHENLHASMDEKKADSPYNNEYLLNALEEIYNELKAAKPDSVFVKAKLNITKEDILNEYKDEKLTDNQINRIIKSKKQYILEDFLIDSLTNFELIKELNDVSAENVTLPTKKKSLLAKLLDKVLNWLSDFLGKDFNVNKDSLLAKEFEIFESVINETPEDTTRREEPTDSSTGDVTESIEPDTITPDNDAINNADINSISLFGAFSTIAVSDNNISSEMQAIKEHAIANGTFMKAPNGNPTNLTERQWLQVRTKAFKKWFGDWEKGLQIEQDSNSYYRGQYEEPIIDKDGNLILKGKKDPLYEKAGYNIEKGVSATTDMQSANDYGSNQRYAYEADVEEKYGDFDQSWEQEQELNEIAEHGYYLIQFPKNIPNQIIKEEGEVKIVGDVVIPKGQYTVEHITDEGTDTIATADNDVSKVVDENGEPLVVWHGGSLTNVFNTTGKYTSAGIKKGDIGVYFTTSEKSAESYENIHDYKYGDAIFTILEELKEEGLSDEEIEKEWNTSMLGLRSGTRAFFLNLKNPKKTHYSGNREDGYTRYDSNIENTDGQVITINDRDEVEYVATHPNQIKSATDNNGDFSNTNNDIRFSSVSVSNSTPAVTAPSIRSFMANLNSDTYTDIQEKLNNGIISIICH